MNDMVTTTASTAVAPIVTDRKKPRQGRDQRHNTVVFVVMTLICIVMLAPLLWLFIASIKSPSELSTWPVKWLPQTPRFNNYGQALKQIPYLSYAANSLFLSTISALLTTVSSSFVAFGFARLRGWGRSVWFSILISMMMMPPIITLIPTYLLMSRIGLVGTYWPWILWGVSGSAYNIFLFRQQFASLPQELQEAPLIDGASWLRIWWSIFLPLSKPILVTSFVLSFVGTWGDFITPQMFLKASNQVLAVGLADGYPNPGGLPQNNLTAAGAMLYILPVVVLVLAVHKQYMASDISSGMKG